MTCLITPCPICEPLAAASVGGPLTSVPGVAVRRGANDSVQAAKVAVEPHKLDGAGSIPAPASSTAVDADPACSGSGTTVAGASASTALLACAPSRPSLGTHADRPSPLAQGFIYGDPW